MDSRSLEAAKLDSSGHRSTCARMLEALKRSRLRRFALCVEQGELFEAFCYVVTRLGIRLPAPQPESRVSVPLRANGHRSRPRIVATVHSLSLEGAPISLVEILAGLIRTTRYEVHLISPSDGPLRKRAESVGCTVHLVTSPQDDSAGARAYEQGVEKFARSLETLQPDLLIANSMATFHAVDAARCVGIPTIWLIRESDSPESFFSLYPRAIQARALACLDYPQKTVFVSQSTMNRWPHGGAAHVLIRTVPETSGIAHLSRSWSRADARQALGVTDDEIMVLTVGTLCANKGQMDLIRAAPAIARSPVRMRIVFVGTVAEPGGHAITQAISRARTRLTSPIEVHDATPDIGKYYAAADIYLCSSRRESYPRTILEALAFGLPIVATTVEGIAEALDGAASRSYPPGDIEALASALRDLAVSAETRAAMATSSRRRWDQIELTGGMIESYARELQELLANTAA